METEFIERLVQINLAAGAAILVVLALRKPAARRLGARMAYALWLAVPAAMLASLIPARTVTIAAPAVPLPPMDVAPMATAPIFEAAPIATLPASAAPLDLSLILLGLWLAGCAAFAIHLAISQRRAVARLGRVEPDSDDPALCRAANPGTGPVLLGVVRPRVVVPADFEDRFEPRERAMILAHENTHLSGGDTRINALIVLIRCLCWFNPLIHLGARFARVDQELACDAGVIARFPGERRAYAQALLKTQLASVPLPLGCYWPGRSPNLLKERIEMLALATPGRGRLAAGAAIAAAFSLAAGLAAWAAQPPQTRFEPAATRNAAAPAFSAPPQAKTATPAPAPTVMPGLGGAPTLPGAAPVLPGWPEASPEQLAGLVPDEPVNAMIMPQPIGQFINTVFRQVLKVPYAVEGRLSVRADIFAMKAPVTTSKQDYIRSLQTALQSYGVHLSVDESGAVHIRQEGEGPRAGLNGDRLVSLLQPAAFGGAVGSALGAPAQAKTAGPPAAPTVQAGAGGGATDTLASGPTRSGPLPLPLTRLQGTPDGYQPGRDHACFQCHFNGNSPMLLQGKLVGVDWADPFIMLRIVDSSGKLYRVQGGRLAEVTPEIRAMIESRIGGNVTVRGYDAIDTACIGGCLVNSRDVNYGQGFLFQGITVQGPPRPDAPATLPLTQAEAARASNAAAVGLDAATQTFLAGGAAQDAARAYLRTGASPGGGGDASTARYFQAPGGGVALGTRSSSGGGYDFVVLPNTQNYPGLSSLPTAAQAFPPAPAR